MKRRLAIAAILGAIAAGAFSGAAIARDCGRRCEHLAQNRGEYEGERRYRPPYLRGPELRRSWREREYREREYYGGPGAQRRRIGEPGNGEPLADAHIWSIVKSRVPGRIVNARLHGPIYSFRIISNRGSIVDVDVDRYSGRIVSVRGGP